MLDRIVAGWKDLMHHFGAYVAVPLLVIAGVAVYAAWNGHLALLIACSLGLVVIVRLAAGGDPEADRAEREAKAIEAARKAADNIALARARDLLNEPSFKQVMPQIDGTEL